MNEEIKSDPTWQKIYGQCSERACDDWQFIIDAFIGLQLTAKNLPKKERDKYVVTMFRSFLVENFEQRFGYLHPVYTNKIKHKESGPYSEDAFDKKRESSLYYL